MTDTDAKPSEASAIIKQLIPWVSVLFGCGAVIYSFANNNSTLIATQNYQGQEIAQLIKAQSDEQTIAYSISTQLAQLQQSVADIKAQTGHGQ